MRTTIRQGSFETNSSSTHSLTMMTPAQYDALNQPNTFFTQCESAEHGLEKNRVYALDELLAAGLDEDTIRAWCEWNLMTFDCNWQGDSYLETDVSRLTTPGGEDIVIVCEYGNDY